MAHYADIISITAPSEATYGEQVNITVKIKNTTSSVIGIMVGGALEAGIIPWPGITFPDFSANVSPGSTKSFAGYFVMLDRNVIIHAYSYYYGSDGYWHFDDEMTKSVNLSAIPEGSISRKELKYNSTQETIPVSDVPQNKSGQVHIWGRNDGSEPMKPGIGWTIRDPNGNIPPNGQYSDWAFGYYQPGKEHEFIGGRFDLDHVGDYTIWAGLYAYPDDANPIDTYEGRLCDVIAELVAGFKEMAVTSISKEEV